MFCKISSLAHTVIIPRKVLVLEKTSHQRTMYDRSEDGEG